MPRDLVNQVPFEILSRIFALCIDDPTIYINVQEAHEIPVEVLARVCSRWRSILFRESRYWTDVEVNFTGLTSSLVNDALLACASRCFSRAGDYLPLSLNLYHLWDDPPYEFLSIATQHSIDPPDEESEEIPPHSVHSFLLSFAHRLETLHLHAYFGFLETFLGPSDEDDEDEDAPQPPAFIRLKTLNLQVVGDDDKRLDMGFSRNYLHTFPILFGSGVPNLHHLTINYDLVLDAPFDNTSKDRPLPVRVSSVPWEQLTYLDLIDVELEYDTFHAVMQLCTRLAALAITPLSIRADSEAKEATSLPLLTTLTLDLSKERQDGFPYIKDFHFPLLENLTLKGSASDVWPTHARNLLRKSPIKRIFLSLIQENGIECLFEYVPRLTHFESDQPLTGLSLNRLKNSGLVPHLERFTCRLRAELLGNFIDMLEARWAGRSDLLSAEISCYLTRDHGNSVERNAKLDRLHREACEQLATFGEIAKGIILTVDGAEYWR